MRGTRLGHRGRGAHGPTSSRRGYGLSALCSKDSHPVLGPPLCWPRAAVLALVPGPEQPSPPLSPASPTLSGSPPVVYPATRAVQQGQGGAGARGQSALRRDPWAQNTELCFRG